MAYQPKSYRKFIATAATATLVASAVAPVLAAEEDSSSTLLFTDVSERYVEAVEYLVANGITEGLTPTQFGTVENIKRVDVAVMVARHIFDEETIDNAPASSFTDVPDRAVKYVNALKDAGIVNGKTETSFGASDNITRGEAAIILANAYGLEADDEDNSMFTDVAPRYTEAVEALVDNEITFGKTATSFGTADSITRGELALFLYRIAQLEDGGSETGLMVSELPEGSYEVQADTLLDTWTIVLRQDQLPEEFQGAEGYELTFEDGTVVVLKQNQFNSNVFNASVSSTTYTEADVLAAVVTPVFPFALVLGDLPEGSYEVQADTLLDTWTIVLRQDQLPEELQGAAGYTFVLEDGTEVALNKNQFNSNVFNGSVSSTTFTEADVLAGVLIAN